MPDREKGTEKRRKEGKMSRLGKCTCGEELHSGRIDIMADSPEAFCKKCLKVYHLELKNNKTHYTVVSALEGRLNELDMGGS